MPAVPYASIPFFTLVFLRGTFVIMAFFRMGPYTKGSSSRR